jgi:hypothetical protein
MKSDMYDAVATEWAAALGQKGIPVAAAKELGRYIGGLEKRIAELNQMIADLARSSAIRINGKWSRK